MNQNNEAVHHPSHYELEGLGVEVIDVIRSVLGEISFCSYCKGNIIKYILRADKKNGLEDYRKARVYLNWLIETMESDDDPEEVEVYTNNEKYQVDKVGGFHKLLP